MGYDAAHTDQTQILSDANNDRQNAAKQAAVERIGQDLETVGQGIAEITDAPAAAQADNARTFQKLHRRWRRSSSR